MHCIQGCFLHCILVRIIRNSVLNVLCSLLLWTSSRDFSWDMLNLRPHPRPTKWKLTRPQEIHRHSKCSELIPLVYSNLLLVCTCHKVFWISFTWPFCKVTKGNQSVSKFIIALLGRQLVHPTKCVTRSVPCPFQRAVQSHFLDFPVGSDSKETSCQAGDRSSIWVEKIPWRKEWLPTPVFLPREFHQQRSLVGYSPWGCKKVRHNWATYIFLDFRISGFHYIQPFRKVLYHIPYFLFLTVEMAFLNPFINFWIYYKSNL